MKRLFKWALRLVVLCVVLMVGLLLSLDSILKALVERQIRAGTGMDVKIGKLSVGWLSPIVTIEDFKLYNTAEYGGTPFLDIRELHVEYDRPALAQRTLHVRLMRVNLTELNVVKNGAGRTNLVEVPSGTTAERHARAGKWQFSGVDVLNLTVGRARFTNLKDPRQNREFNANLQNQVFWKVKTMDDLNGILLMIWLRSGGGFVHSLQSPCLATPPEVSRSGYLPLLTPSCIIPGGCFSFEATTWPTLIALET